MIPGFNTDVEHDNVVYHIQTEDKGEKNRLVLSLVYDRGTILASKRVSYSDIFDGAFDEKILAEKMQRQHQLICAAIKAGRVNDLKKMSGAAKEKPVSAAAEMPRPAVQVYPGAATVEVAVPPITATAVVRPNIVEAAPPPVQSRPAESELPLVKFAAIQEVPHTAPASPAPPQNEIIPEIFVPAVEIPEPPLRTEIFVDEPIFEDVRIIEEPQILPATAVAVVSELSGTERPKNQKLTIELLGDSRFKGGDRRTVGIMVCRGTERRVVANAEIMLKVIGSSFRPLIFHAKSDANGLARVHLQLPHFDAGRAALLIRAIESSEETELRRIVSPG